MRPPIVAPICLILGALLGLAGTLVSSASLRGLASGVDGAALVSAPRVFQVLVRSLGIIAVLLFAVTALQVFAGRTLTPLSEPLPFFAYPFLVFTMFGWAWVCWRVPQGEPRASSSES